jgi:hypothetical protein
MNTEEIIKDIKGKFELLIAENQKAIAKIYDQEPELSKKISGDMAEVVNAIKNNDMSKLTELQKRYGNHTDK